MSSSSRSRNFDAGFGSSIIVPIEFGSGRELLVSVYACLSAGSEHLQAVVRIQGFACDSHSTATPEVPELR